MALTNNDILKKLRVAVQLRDDDIIEILKFDKLIFCFNNFVYHIINLVYYLLGSTTTSIV